MWDYEMPRGSRHVAAKQRVDLPQMTFAFEHDLAFGCCFEGEHGQPKAPFCAHRGHGHGGYVLAE